jgi:hypothetical protein
MRSLVTCTSHLGNQIEKKEMGWACSTYREEEVCIQGFDEEREKGLLADPHVGGRIILRWIFGRAVWGMDWSDLAKDRNSWRALVNAVKTLPDFLKCGNSFISSEQVSFSRRTVLHGISKCAVCRILFAILILSCSGRIEN